MLFFAAVPDGEIIATQGRNTVKANSDPSIGSTTTSIFMKP